MEVWIAEQGCYEDRHVSGVYATADAAVAAHPIPEPVPAHNRMARRDPGWVEDTNGDWNNNLDWDAAVVVYRCEVEA